MCLQFMKKHLQQFPEQAASIQLACQRGQFDASRKKSDSEWIADVKRIDRLSDDMMMDVLKKAYPKLSADMWLAIQRAEYNGKKDADIIKQLFMSTFCLSEGEALPTRSKSLLRELLLAKREAFKNKAPPHLSKQFHLDFTTDGVYKLVGDKMVDKEKVFTHILHKPSQTKVPGVTLRLHLLLVVVVVVCVREREVGWVGTWLPHTFF